MPACIYSQGFLMITIFSLAALIGIFPRSSASATTPLVQPVFHHATYRDCAWRRPNLSVAASTLATCATITATWPTFARQPGVESHLRTHVLSFDGKHPTKPLEARNAQNSLRQVLLQELQRLGFYAQESYTVSIVTNRQGILILQDKWTFDGGGAHAYEGIHYFTYDTAHDHVLTLADLFIPGYEPKLLQLVREAFAQQRATYAQSDLLHASTELVLSTNFLPTHQGLRFYYNAGEAGAWAAGPVEVALSWRQLEKFIRPASIVRTL